MNQTINIYYIDADNKPSIAGAYYFPKVKAGHEFRFEIVSAFPGYTPVGFKGFCIYDERLRIPEEDTEAGAKIGSRTSDVDAAYHDSVRIADSIATVAAIEAERAARVVTAPKYPGGTQALYSFLRKNMRKPQIAIETAGYGVEGVRSGQEITPATAVFDDQIRARYKVRPLSETDPYGNRWRWRCR